MRRAGGRSAKVYGERFTARQGGDGQREVVPVERKADTAVGLRMDGVMGRRMQGGAERERRRRKKKDGGVM